MRKYSRQIVKIPTIFLLSSIAFLSIFLSGCGSSSTTQVAVENISFNIPNDYQTIAPSALDSAQITHNIIAAWKNTDSNIILASSSLPAQVSLKDFAQNSKTRISQEMMGYTNGSISSKTFTCNSKKTTGYLHSFNKADIKDSKNIVIYYNQYYFLQGETLYILSLAQNNKKSIVDTIIGSIACKQADIAPAK